MKIFKLKKSKIIINDTKPNNEVIKNKFSIGDMVWFIRYGIIYMDVINNINISNNQIIYGIGKMNYMDCVRFSWVKENEIFSTKEELYDKIILRIKEINNEK